MLKYQLPDLYRNLFPKEILNLKISEEKATCDNCLRSRDKRYGHLYNENLKCCTFQPFLPNFAVGGILYHKLSGSEIIQNKISKQDYTLPIGIFPDLNYQEKFQNKKKNDFGQRQDLLCPYYSKSQNKCSIWLYRGVVCTTYFCASSYGKDGLKYWGNLNDYLSFVEMALAEDNLVMKGFSPRDISDQLVYLNFKSFKEKKELSLTAVSYKKFWQGYDDVEKFYIDCYKMVSNMKRKDFLVILGNQGLKVEQNLIGSGRCLKIK